MHQPHISTIYRQELKGRIINAATDLFYRNGIKSVKMDDIAGYLSISKRTLYEIYDNKEVLLFEVVKLHEEQLQERMSTLIADGKGDVMDCLLNFYRIQMKELASVNPAFFADLQKYPKLLEYIMKKHERNHEQSAEFMQRGIQAGYFLPDVNYEMLHRIAEGVNKLVFDTSFYKDYPLEDIFRNLIRMFLRGICTEEGIKRIDESI